ncbi:MAG: hypothetical protein Kow0079_12860 [Vicingaceae bacterium]
MACNTNETTENNHQQTNDTLPQQESAFLIINKKLQNDINNPELYYERAMLYAEREDLKSAIADLDRALKIDSTNCKYLIQKADFLFIKKKFGESKFTLEKCVKHNKTNDKAWLKLGEIALYAGNFKKSLEYADAALKINKYNPDAYFLKGMIFMSMQDTVKALSSFNTAKEQDNDYYNAYIQLGEITQAQKNPLAKDYYLNALRIRPNSVEALYHYAMYCQENGLYNEALETYTKITKIDPLYRHAYFNMGYIHLQYLFVYDIARDYFTKAIEVHPYYFEAYYNRGLCYEFMNDYENAKKDFQQALKIKPNYDYAAEGLSRLEKKH